MTDKPTLAELKETLTRREAMLSYPPAHWTPHDIRVIEVNIAELKAEIAECEKPEPPKFGNGI